MNERSTNAFIAIAKVAKVIFETGYIDAKFQPTITASELTKKTKKLSIAWGRVNTEELRATFYRNFGIRVDESGEIITIKQEKFECTFNIHWTFELLVKFARLAREEKAIKKLAYQTIHDIHMGERTREKTEAEGQAETG